MKHTAQLKITVTLLIVLMVSIFSLSNSQTIRNLIFDDEQAIDAQIFSMVASPIHSAVSDCQLSGQIIHVLDGDSVILQDGRNTQHNIRLAGIDAPEYNQAFGEQSKHALTELILMESVCVSWKHVDDYQRKIGIVFLDDKDVNLEMISQGLAWHYKRFEKTQSEENRQRYSDHENDARLAKIGIWSQKKPIAPWDWRETAKDTSSESSYIRTFFSPILEPINRYRHADSCDGKRYCKEMKNCNQACFYLQECDLNRLDRDQDGIPCETLCQSKCI